ncbi:MAG TPA: ABC transporter permease subunit [Candidatus Limnocylindria bacterium]|nr:ABC transporter permease subunit [Candidatus Limnocylindria bacterium]
MLPILTSALRAPRGRASARWSTHAFRNLMLAIIGLFVAVGLTGTVLTETVFTRPGLGKMLVDAIGARDHPLAQGAITVFTMIIIVVNLASSAARGSPGSRGSRSCWPCSRPSGSPRTASATSRT